MADAKSMNRKSLLTDNSFKAMKPTGQRWDWMDTDTRGLGVRIGASGKRTFMLYTRYPGSSAPTRRELGEYPVMTLAEARTKARKWRDLIKQGINPKDDEDRAKAEQARKRENTWATVVEDYLVDIPTRSRNRHVEQDAREIRRELLERNEKDGKEWRNPWAKKPIADITDADIAELISAIRDRPAPGQAYNTWGHVKAIFSWAMWPERRQGYGLTDNPTRNLQPKHFKLSKTVSVRVLSDDEIRAYWQAADTTPYPLGPFHKMLILTGQRKAEVSDARWSEFDLNKKIWTVPPERFKSGQTHIVPLSDDAVKLLKSIPRFKGQDSGDHLFSTTTGKKPINGFSRAKSALDAEMLAELRKAQTDATLVDFVYHDVRRTVRTRLSALRVNRDVAELVIGHGKKGLDRVYDQHEFVDEMREALDRWAAKLADIVKPPKGDNLIQFPTTA
ncbi:integrase arm-type DNA-binding domain-containing protein [Aminobacter aminovorans]|uniref:tyrosine-type recombinase/integrase n=1 Tax=Aminobacter aminovorans TaxID=83263 RepID=UPI00285E5E50|nr:integrase arm-type DNA-binding domain-containing protein [Aminobacter aminovorans]MDR7219871.1 integrase [Aminobacter aminovorans]